MSTQHPSAPHDPRDDRVQRLEESIGFLEHTLDGLSKQYANLQADLTRAVTRIRVLEQREATRGQARVGGENTAESNRDQATESEGRE